MKYLGVDYGLKRIGLAISEGTLASPLKVLEISSLNDAVNKMIQIIKVENVDQVVVGMPEGETGKKVQKFVKKLKQNGLDVKEADETLSSQNALSDMIASGIPREKRKTTDATAAAIILQEYLDSL